MTHRVDTLLATTRELHIYVDSATGDDDNDGLSWGAAKATIQGGINATPPIIQHNVMIHLRGTYNFAGLALVRKILQPTTDPTEWLKYVVTGDEDPTILSGPHTSDINSISSIGLTTAGWTADEHAGYWVKILTGPAAGDRRRVFSNTTTTISPHRNFSADPGSSAQFQVERPATQVGGGWETMICEMSGSGSVWFQNLYLSDNAAIWIQDATDFRIGHMIINYRWGGRNAGFQVTDTMIDDTFAFDTTDRAGLTTLTHAAEQGWLAGSDVSLYASHLAGLTLSACRSTAANFTDGSRCKGPMVLMSYSPADELTEAMFSLGSYPDSRQNKVDNTSGVGLRLIGTNMIMGDIGLDLSDCGSHGLELDHSRLDLSLGNLVGSGNTGAGVYAHNGSVLQVKDGTPPTVTGTVGDVAVSDPTEEESTWAAVEAGTDVAVVSEMTLVKKGL